MARLSGRLPNRLAEMLVVVGVDESSGVKAKHNGNNVDGEQGPWKTVIEPQLLAAVSSRLAVFPFHDPPQDRKYPPMGDVAFVSARRSPVEKRSRFPFGKKDRVTFSPETKSVKNDKASIQGKLSRRVSRRMSFIQANDKVDGKSGNVISIEAGDLSVPFDVLNSLCSLCFPDDEYISEGEPQSKVHYLVLTDMAGNRSHATCLTYWSSYRLTKSKKGDGTLWDCSPCGDAGVVSDVYQCWLPICLLIISKYPYYTLFKDCLSKLCQKIEKNRGTQYYGLTDMALQLTMTPVPPAGQVKLSFSIDDTRFLVQPAENPYRVVVDLPLVTIFQHFSPDQVQKLMTAILTQQRLVFLSSTPSLLTTIMESLLQMMHPFEWRSPYVPVLPKHLLELLDAPGTFIMGCHTSHRHIVTQIEGLVIADIDQGTITLSNTINFPIIPVEPSSVFLMACQEFVHKPNHGGIDRATFFTYEEMKAAELESRDRTNQQILQASLQLMVNLFRPLLPYVKMEQRFFKKDQFIESISEEYQLFYSQVLETEMLGQFLKDRFAGLKDSWTALEERTRPVIRRSFTSDSDLSAYGKRKHSVLSLPSPLLSTCPSWSSFNDESITIALPHFSAPLHKLYYSKCITDIELIVRETKITGVRASCLHLIAMLNVANKQPLKGLKYLSDIHAYDSRIFPRDLVSAILREMSDEECSELKRNDFYKQSSDLKMLLDGVSSKRDWERERPIIMHIDKLPDRDLDFNGFAEKCHILEIATDQETIHRLFEALTLNIVKPKVDSVTFALLYEGWKEVEMERLNSKHDLVLDEGECFLKVSTIIKTSMGTGRLALTQKRMFFLPDGSKKSKEIVKLLDMKAVDRISTSSFLSQLPAIRIATKDLKKQPFIATVKEQRDTWHMVIVEMWSGKLISDELRDVTIAHQASQNVLLIDSLLRSGEDAEAQHHELRQESAEHMCYFTQRRLKGVDKLPEETKDMLQHRVDPNQWEQGRSAIEALLYTPGKRSSNELENRGPQLWCGIGNGKVQVFDASNWRVESSFIQAKEKIVCLVAVGLNQVWAGSLDSNIYVININTRICHQTLLHHASMVTDMLYLKDDKRVVSTDIMGVIVVWDVETVQAIKSFRLPDNSTTRCLRHYQGNLWCCTKEEVIVTDLNGKVIHSISPAPGKKFSSPLDCIIITDTELWVGCSREGQILVWDTATLESKEGITLQCQGISKMLLLQGRVWAGTKDGFIYIIDSKTHNIYRMLHAHSDAIRSICSAQTRYVLSGSGSRDGKIAIWRTNL